MTLDKFIRLRATDTAQCRIRRALASLAAARAELAAVVESDADADVRSAADDAIGQIDNAVQSADVALRWAVDASGHEVVMPVAVAVAAE